MWNCVLGLEVETAFKRTRAYIWLRFPRRSLGFFGCGRLKSSFWSQDKYLARDEHPPRGKGVKRSYQCSKNTFNANFKAHEVQTISLQKNTTNDYCCKNVMVKHGLLGNVLRSSLFVHIFVVMHIIFSWKYRGRVQRCAIMLFSETWKQYFLHVSSGQHKCSHTWYTWHSKHEFKHTYMVFQISIHKECQILHAHVYVHTHIHTSTILLAC